MVLMAPSAEPVSDEPVAGGRRTTAVLGVVLLTAALACFLLTGLAGIDFGHHWDEPVQLNLVNETISTGRLLPGDFYDWPPVTYLLSVIGVAPRVWGRLGSTDLLDPALFFVPVRRVFLLVTALGGLWLYVALKKEAGPLGAAAGSITYLLSFQLAYHSRWIAPDAVLASMTSLFMMVVVMAWRRPPTSWWSYAPAAAAGLAAATKYQGAILLLGALLSVGLRPRSEREGGVSLTRSLGICLAMFTLVFVLLTPGVLLQPKEFVGDLRSVNEHYRATKHANFHGAYPYFVPEVESYAKDMVSYVFGSLPSRSLILSGLTSSLAAVGLINLVRTDRRLAVVLFVPGAVVAISFLPLNVLIVRNFLLFLPFLAFLAGTGFGALWRLFRGPAARVGLVALLLLPAAWNGAWLVRASRTVANRGDVATAVATADWVRDHDGDGVVLSGGVRALLAAENVDVPANARRSGPTDWLAVRLEEVQQRTMALRKWPATERGTYRVLGPMEVDFDFYPTWEGDDRVLVFSSAEVRDFGLPWEWG
jgi:hypothetical protein